VSRRAAWFLYAFAAWTVFVWVVFIKNIARAHQYSFGFKAVHIVLAAISIVFAAVSFTVVRRVRRPASGSESPVSAGRH
jgi:Na+/melibiose symporter-like transporter